MGYTVSVSSTYRRGCRTCTEEAERIAVQGIRDAGVTSITLRAANTCEHQAEPTRIDTGKQPTLPNLKMPPASDTNGLDWSAE